MFLTCDDAAKHIIILPPAVHADRSRGVAQRLTGKGLIHEAWLVEIVSVSSLDEDRAKPNAATGLQVQGQARTPRPHQWCFLAIRKARIDPAAMSDLTPSFPLIDAVDASTRIVFPFLGLSEILSIFGSCRPLSR